MRVICPHCDRKFLRSAGVSIRACTQRFGLRRNKLPFTVFSFWNLNTVQSRMRREPREGSFSDYFSLGGHLRQAPTPEPTVAADALAYLQECNFTVYPAPLGEGEPKYVYQGQVLTLDRLVAIANDHRALRQLPPFPFLQ